MRTLQADLASEFYYRQHAHFILYFTFIFLPLASLGAPLGTPLHLRQPQTGTTTGYQDQYHGRRSRRTKASKKMRMFFKVGTPRFVKFALLCLSFRNRYDNAELPAGGGTSGECGEGVRDGELE